MWSSLFLIFKWFAFWSIWLSSFESNNEVFFAYQLSIYLSVCVSACMVVCLSVCLTVYLLHHLAIMPTFSPQFPGNNFLDFNGFYYRQYPSQPLLILCMHFLCFYLSIFLSFFLYFFFLSFFLSLFLSIFLYFFLYFTSCSLLLLLIIDNHIPWRVNWYCQRKQNMDIFYSNRNSTWNIRIWKIGFA